MVTTRRTTIGFDRKIRLSWLDATADWAAQGLPAEEIRTRLERLLEGALPGSAPKGARYKSKAVLLHVWVTLPDEFVPLRNDGLKLLRLRSGKDRLPLHWGMCLSTYPFFHDLAATTGRLLQIQGTAALSQIARRMAESWGDRSTVVRAVQRVTRCFVDWGALRDTREAGVYAALPKTAVREPDSIWMLEAALADCGSGGQPFRSLITSPVFFPFELNLSARDVGRSARLEIHRQGFDDDLVVPRSRARDCPEG